MSTLDSSAITEIDADGRATVTLNRPAADNALDGSLIRALLQTFRTLARDPDVRVVVLAAAGKAFSAGADLDWLRRARERSTAETRAELHEFAAVLNALSRLPQPTVAAVQGTAFGGAIGLVACCDIALASAEAQFSMPEVKIGLIPAIMSPYVVAAVGHRQAQRFMLTGETFDAPEALRIGLVHDVVPATDLKAAVDGMARTLLANGPQAMAATKDLIAAVSGRAGDDHTGGTSARFARALTSKEGQEGVAAILAGRAPAWIRK